MQIVPREGFCSGLGVLLNGDKRPVMQTRAAKNIILIHPRGC